MSGMAWALLISILTGSLLAAIFFARMMGALKQLADAEAELDTVKKNLAMSVKGLELSEDARKDETARLEGVVSALKKEIAGLEEDLATCSNPDAVRERLRRLLNSGESGGDPAGYGTMPFGGTPRT